MNEEKIKLLKCTLKELEYILYYEIGLKSHFEDLDRSIKILEQRNENHYISISKKMKNLTILLYQTGVMHNNEGKYLEINKKLDEISILLNE